jgi:hypothetical protein
LLQKGRRTHLPTGQLIFELDQEAGIKQQHHAIADAAAVAILWLLA